MALVGPAPYPFDERERAVAQWSFDHRQAAGRGTTTLPGRAARCTCRSRRPAERSGSSGCRWPSPAEFRDPARRRLLEALAGQTAAALERLALAERSRESEVEVEAERLRTALLSSLSHDMRTPLASIEGAASTLLQESEPAPAARRDLAATIVQESHRMGRLVANLLDMIRVEAGALQVQKEWQLLSDVVGVALLRTEEQLRGHPVTTTFPPDLPLVPMDEILLEQVFVNLLENAAKHTPAGHADRGRRRRPARRGGRVRRRPRAGPAAGRGGDDLPASSIAAAAPPAGIGLGLTICRGIVTAHGGRIWAENRPGGGAIFRLALADHRHAADARRRGARSNRQTRGRHMDRPAPLVLLIEDEPQMRRFLRTALGANDYRLVEAETAKEGLAQAAARNPDVILLDLGLPDRDGLEVARELREWSATPIIVLSARGREAGQGRRRSTSAPTTTSPSRSAWTSCSRGSGWRCATRRCRRAARRSRCSRPETLRVDLAARRVWRAGEEIHLTPTEYKLLTTLVRHAGKVLTHRQLLKEVWGANYVNQSHYVRVYLAQLRQKIEADPARPTAAAHRAGRGLPAQGRVTPASAGVVSTTASSPASSGTGSRSTQPSPTRGRFCNSATRTAPSRPGSRPSTRAPRRSGSSCSGKPSASPAARSWANS